MSYLEYKNSGEKWIGKIPKSWQVEFIREFYDYRSEKVSDKIYSPLSVTKKGILPQLENAAKTDNNDSRKKVMKGDFVINSRSDRKGSCGVSPFEGSVSLIYHVLTPKDKTISKFSHYLFRSVMFAEEFYKWGHGIVDDLWSTKWEDMKKIKIPMPPKEERLIIANYLDKKIKNIDNQIDLNKKLINLLEEKRTALINQVVTKGLNPEVPMKDSGIEWIGEIPEHWDINRLKFLITKNAQYGANCEPEADEDKFDYRYVRITDIDDNSTLKDNIVFLSKDNAKGFILNEGDVLFARSGATVGKTYLYDKNDGECCFAGYLIRYVTNKHLLNPKYLLYFSFSKSYIEWIKIVSTQATIQNVSADKYDNLIISLPEIKEQNTIVNYLDKETSKINKTITKIKENISLLEEYKTSLIHHVVTGKIDVRGEEI